MRIPASFLSAFWARVVAGSFKAETPRELLLTRVAALFRLTDPSLRETAKAFVLSTMTIGEADYNFPAREKLMAEMTDVQAPEVLCERVSDEVNAIVYKIPYTVAGDTAEKAIHEISFFDRHPALGWIFTRKYNLAALAEQATAPSALVIRQIHDEVLHRPAATVTDFSSPVIQEQVGILRRALYATGGAGIAANQCLEIPSPLRIILAGTDYENPDHTAKVITRYPGVLFLPMECFLNPRIIEVSDQKVAFREGCLSVQGTARAQVLRPDAVTIEYENLQGETNQKKFTGADARVMLHEVDHINNGKVYFQHVLSDLTAQQLEVLKRVTQQAIAENVSVGITNPFAAPILLFKRNSLDQLEFDEKEVLEVFKQIPRETLSGILAKAEQELRCRPLTTPVSMLYASPASPRKLADTGPLGAAVFRPSTPP